MKTPPREALILGIGSVLSAGVIIGGIVWGLNRDDGPDVSAPASAHAQDVTVSARGAALVAGPGGVTRLVMTGVDPQVDMTDISPGGERMSWPTWLWTKDWARRYAAVEPNASLTWTADGMRHRTSFALVRGQYAPGHLVFTLRPLAPGNSGRLPITAAQAPGSVRRLGPVDLFVDPPGQVDPTSNLANDASLAASLKDVAIGETEGAATTPPYQYTGGTQTVEPGPKAPPYAGLALASGSPNQVSLLLKNNPVFDSMNAAGRVLILGNVGGSTAGAVIAGLTAGRLVLVNLLADNQPAVNNVFIAPTVSDGEVQFPHVGSTTPGNMFYNADFSGSTFSGGDLSRSVFVAADLSGVRFTQSGNAMNAVFLGSNFADVSFDGPLVRNKANAGSDAPVQGPISFSGAVFGPWQSQDEAGTTSTVPTSFADVVLNNGATFASYAGLPATSLNGVIFNGASLRGTDFTAAQVVGCTFNNATLGALAVSADKSVATSFAGATLTNDQFANATIGNVSFKQATLTGADFSLATFSPGTAASFRYATLGPGTVFKSSSGIAQADFTGATLDGVVFARGGGDDAPPAFVASLLTQIKSTSEKGFVINNLQYIKPAGSNVIYQIDGNGTRTEVQVSNGQVVPVGGGGNGGGGGGNDNRGGGGGGGAGGGGGNVQPDNPNGGNPDDNNPNNDPDLPGGDVGVTFGTAAGGAG